MTNKVKYIYPDWPKIPTEKPMWATESNQKISWTVTHIKARVDKWLDNYCGSVLYIFEHWNFNMDDLLRWKFANATVCFWDILRSIHFNQKRNLYLYNTDINNLTVPEQFKKTVLCFLIDPDDILNITLMKQYLERVISYPWEDEIMLDDLYEYFEVIIRATKFNLINWHLDINLSFLDKIEK